MSGKIDFGSHKHTGVLPAETQRPPFSQRIEPSPAQQQTADHIHQISITYLGTIKAVMSEAYLVSIENGEKEGLCPKLNVNFKNVGDFIEVRITKMDGRTNRIVLEAIPENPEGQK